MSAFTENSLLPIYVDDKAGYIDSSGAVIVEPRYDDAYTFSEGLGRVACGSRCGFIDYSGQVAVPIRFVDVGPEFHEGLCSFRAGASMASLWGYVDTAGATVIAPMFEQAEEFSDGVAVVKNNGKSQVIDHTGSSVLVPNCNSLHSFYEGRSVASVGRGAAKAWGLIDKSGGWVLPPSMYRLASVVDGAASFVRIRERPTAGLVDLAGIVLWEVDIDNRHACGNYSEGVLLVEQHGEQRFLDRNGTVAVVVSIPHDPSLTSVGDFHSGLAAVSVGRRRDKLGQLVRERCGYIDRGGQVKIPLVFDSASTFSDGVALVQFEGTTAYIDTEGAIIWSTKGWR